MKDQKIVWVFLLVILIIGVTLTAYVAIQKPVCLLSKDPILCLEVSHDRQ